jgi:hypothetical protein
MRELSDWIAANRDMIDRHIQKAVSNIIDIDDDEREMWVMNDETLYIRAAHDGVEL